MIRNFWLDATFLLEEMADRRIMRNCVGVKNVWRRDGPHKTSVHADPAVVQWLKDNVEGLYRTRGDITDLSPSITAEEATYLVWFSRYEDSIKFKLAH